MRKKENNHGFKQIIFLKQHEVVEYLNSTRTVTSIWCITNALSRYMQCWQGKILESKHDSTQFSTINNDIKQRSTNNKESIRYFKKNTGNDDVVHGNIGPLCLGYFGHRWIPLTEGQ